jgi:lactate dehydrogenase-like 2-hydroxyacid dehydrogenase
MTRSGEDVGMKPEIVIVGPMYPPTQARLEELFTAHRLWEAADRDAFLDAVRDRVRGIAVYALHGCPAALIEALPRVEIIACFGIGVDAIDLDAAKARGIRVTNTPDVVTEDTADIAISLILGVERRIAEGDRFVRRGDWRNGELRFGRRLGGRKLGIIGLGRIGRAIAKRAEAFGMSIAYHGPRRKPEVPYRFVDNLVDLASWSEILVVACPGGAATRHLVNRVVLEALGPAGTIVNIARGSIVDEQALVAALKSGVLGAAGLDVFENEPFVPPELVDLENVVLMPHTGSATHETRAAMGKLVIDNLLSHFSGRPLITPVV